MKTDILKRMTLAITLLLITSMGFSQTDMEKPLAGIDDTKEYNTIDLIYMDKDLSIFANLLTLSGLDVSLAMIDNNHTLFVPTNEAFNDMTIEQFAELTNPKNRVMLVKFVNRHFTGTKLYSYNLSDSNILDLDGTSKIEIYKEPNALVVGGATVKVGDIETANGLIHVVDDVVNVAK